MTTLALQLDESPHVLAVSGFDDASCKWDAIVRHQCWGSNEAPSARIIDTSTGRQVARISYNGRVWGNDGKEIRTRGMKTAAEHEAEGWADFIMR